MISKSTTSMTPHGLSPATVWVVPVRRISGSAARTAVAGARTAPRIATTARTRAVRARKGCRIRSLLLVGPSPARNLRYGGTEGRSAQTAARTVRQTGSDHPGRGGVGLEQDRSIDPESLEIAGRWRRPVDEQLGHDPAEDRGELEAVRGPERDDHARRLGQAIDHEIAIRGEGVQAGLGVDRRAERARQMARNEALDGR